MSPDRLLYNMALAALLKQAQDPAAPGAAPVDTRPGWLQNVTNYGLPIAGTAMGMVGGIPGMIAGAGAGMAAAKGYEPGGMLSPQQPVAPPAPPPDPRATAVPGYQQLNQNINSVGGAQ